MAMEANAGNSFITWTDAPEDGTAFLISEAGFPRSYRRTFQSVRRASAGSTFAARLARSQLASTVIPATTESAAPKIAGSRAPIPNSCCLMSFVDAQQTRPR